MSDSFFRLLIPVLVWLYAGILLVRLLDSEYARWPGARFLRPYCNLLTLFLGPVMAVVVWFRRLLRLLLTVCRKLGGWLFNKLREAMPKQAPPPKKPILRLIDHQGTVLDSDDARIAPEARATLRRALAALLERQRERCVLEPKPDGSAELRLESGSSSTALETLPTGRIADLLFLVKILAGMNPREHARPQQGKFSVRYGETFFTFSAECAGTDCGERFMLRKETSEPTAGSPANLAANSAAAEEDDDFPRLAPAPGVLPNRLPKAEPEPAPAPAPAPAAVEEDDDEIRLKER